MPVAGVLRRVERDGDQRERAAEGVECLPGGEHRRIAERGLDEGVVGECDVGFELDDGSALADEPPCGVPIVTNGQVLEGEGLGFSGRRHLASVGPLVRLAGQNAERRAPPSTGMTYPAQVEQRKATTAAISSGRPGRPAGMPALNWVIMSAGARPRCAPTPPT